MDTGTGRLAVDVDGEREQDLIRFIVDFGGGMAIHTIQECLPHALPVASRFPGPAPASGKLGRSADGSASWLLLPGMLLVPDGLVVRWRSHEPLLDHRTGGICFCGKVAGWRKKADSNFRRLATFGGDCDAHWIFLSDEQSSPSPGTLPLTIGSAPERWQSVQASRSECVAGYRVCRLE